MTSGDLSTFTSSSNDCITFLIKSTFLRGAGNTTVTHFLEGLPVIDSVHDANHIRLQRGFGSNQHHGEQTSAYFRVRMQPIPWRSPDKAARPSARLLDRFQTQLFTLRSNHLTGSALNLVGHYLSSPLCV